MIMRLSSLIVALTLSAATSLIGTTAKAQLEVDCTTNNTIDCVNPFPLSFYTLDEAMNDAYFRHYKPVYEDQLVPRQLNYIFGFGGSFFKGAYPEIEITKDARSVHEFYVEALRLQNNSGPVLRTRNLPNPYNTSVLQLQNSLIINPNPVPGVELYNEGLPPQ